MKDFPTIPLGEIIAARKGSVDPSKFPDEVFDLYSIPAFESGQPEIVSGQDIGSTKQIVQPGDTLLSKIVPHIRRAWVVEQDNGRRLIASSEWIVFRGDRVHPGYLRYVLIGNPFHAQFMQTVSGVGGSLLRARPAEVAKIKIPLPPLSEQRRIAAILDRADGLRRKRRQALRLTDQFLRAAFLDLFGDPVRNPKGWPTKRLDEIASVNRGKFTPRPRNDPRYYGGRHPFIQTGELSRCSGTLRSWTQTLNELGITVSRKFPKGTIAIAIAANIGDTAILGFDAYLTDSVVGIEVKPEHAAVEYVEFWLRFEQALLKQRAPETAQKNINLQVLRPLPVPMPPISLQQKFTRCFQLVERQCERFGRGEIAVNALFHALAQRAFRGEL